MKVVPAILETLFSEISRKLSLVQQDSVQTVQIDICDGVFVPTVTWPFLKEVPETGTPFYDASFREILDSAGEINMPLWESFDFELDLMVSNPKALVPDLLSIGPSRMVFHVDALNDPMDDMTELQKLIPGLVDIGIALSLDTPLESVFELIESAIVSSVQCMGIAHIGVQGEVFDERVLEKVRVLRERYSDIDISVDGGVTLENAPRIFAAGATRVVVGSSIFSSDDPLSRIADFESLL